MTAHPAKFSDAILPTINRQLESGWLVLDPFAGSGRIHELRPRVITIGVELEPEWAAMSPYTLVGDATALQFTDGRFDAVATSPVYGNRMSDHHEAKDDSKRHTYRHYLGRPLSPNSACAMHWPGDAYERLHLLAWREAIRVLRPEGRFILNVKNFYKTEHKGEPPVLQDVTTWHCTLLQELGLELLTICPVATPGQRHGANGDLRVDHESVVTFIR